MQKSSSKDGKVSYKCTRNNIWLYIKVLKEVKQTSKNIVVINCTNKDVGKEIRIFHISTILCKLWSF